MTTYLVHPIGDAATVKWLADKHYIHVDHIVVGEFRADRINAEDVVVGDLPIHEVETLCSRGGYYWHITLPNKSGATLSYEYWAHSGRVTEYQAYRVARPAIPYEFVRDRSLEDRLPATATEEQRQAICAAGAQRRAAARHEAAREKLAVFIDRVMTGSNELDRRATGFFVRRGLEAILASIPKEAFGVQGTYRIAALRSALAELPSLAPDHKLRYDRSVLCIERDDEDDTCVARIDTTHFSRLVYYMINAEIQRQAAPVDAWMARGGDLAEMPSLPDQDLIEARDELVNNDDEVGYNYEAHQFDARWLPD